VSLRSLAIQREREGGRKEGNLFSVSQICFFFFFLAVLGF
jgi:hypothetical protein